MLFLDMRTVLLVALLASVLCAAVMAGLWRQTRSRIQGVELWFAANLLQGAGALVVALRGPIPSGLSIALGCPMVIAGLVLLYWGLEDYIGQVRSTRAGLAFFVVYTLVHEHFAFIQPSMNARNAWLAIGAAVLAWQGAYLLLRRTPPVLREETRRVGVVLVLVGLVNLYRSISEAFLDAPADVFQSHPSDVLVVLVSTMLLIYLTFALILMVNRRLTGALEDEVAQLEAASRALRESEEKVSGAFKTSPFAIAISRARDGKYLEFNDALCRLTGYSKEELESGTAISLGLWANPVQRDLWVGRLASGGAISGAEVEFRRKGGEVFTGLLSSGRLTVKGEECILSIISDHSEVLQAAREKEKLKEDLAQAQKMESIGQLAGGVAHDFNNMLTVILGHAEFGLGQVAPGHPVAENLLEIRGAAERSAELTRQLLAFARKQPVDPVVLDLDTAIGGMLGMLRRLLGEELELAWAPGASPWKTRLDPMQLEQVLVNLCVNAHDALGGAGKVWLRTGTALVDPAAAAQHSGAQPGEYVVLEVADKGCGMDAETLARAFEPFFTTKGTGKGTGLGLATVYGIVQQNQGFIETLSAPGEGTTFRIHLPRHGDEAAALSAEPGAGELPGGEECILLVEDEPNILKMTTRMLESLGYRVLACGGGPQALHLAKDHGLGIGLLVTDVIMPSMNGQELARQLRQHVPGLPCLYVSGYTSDVLDAAQVPLEGSRFLRKPFSRRSLALAVRGALDA